MTTPGACLPGPFGVCSFLFVTIWVAPENRARELRTRGLTVLTQDSQGSQMVGLLIRSKGSQVPRIVQETVIVTNNSSPQQKASQTYSVTIAAGLTISTASLPNGVISVAYTSTTLQAQSGIAPYNWTAAGLPAGLSLSTAGVLSGTPTATGPFSVTVKVTDSSTPQQTASKTYSLTIASSLTISTASLPNGVLNATYPATTLQAQSGTAPYTWSAAGLPAGLSLSTAVVLSGTPTA